LTGVCKILTAAVCCCSSNNERLLTMRCHTDLIKVILTLFNVTYMNIYFSLITFFLILDDDDGTHLFIDWVCMCVDFFQQRSNMIVRCTANRHCCFAHVIVFPLFFSIWRLRVPELADIRRCEERMNLLTDAQN
jgi:hypothetical protein